VIYWLLQAAVAVVAAVAVGQAVFLTQLVRH
jgi:hypothetical protein